MNNYCSLHETLIIVIISKSAFSLNKALNYIYMILFI